MSEINSDILTRCQCGDKAAFRWVVQTYQQMLFSLALKMLANEEDAKDAVQDTFIRVWQNIGSYNPQRPFTTWLYTIMSRLCIDRIKTAKVLVPLPEDEKVLKQFASESDNQRRLENSEWVSIVRMLAEGLSEK